MDYLKMDGISFPYPNDFTMQKQLNVTNSFETLSGRTVYDTNGYKYADQTFQWDYLRETELRKLLNTVSDVFTLEFEDVDGTTHSVKAIRTSAVRTKTRFKNSDGTIIWTDIQMEVTFPDVL